MWIMTVYASVLVYGRVCGLPGGGTVEGQGEAGI